MSIAQNLPGPLALARLVAEGAMAVKVEPPAGDPVAAFSPAWYDELHRGVSVRRLDLKNPRGRATLDRLLARADLLPSNPISGRGSTTRFGYRMGTRWTRCC